MLLVCPEIMEGEVRVGTGGVPGERVVTDYEKFLVAQRGWSR